MFNLFRNPNGAWPAAPEPVGLVAGGGDLPVLLARAVEKKGNPLVVVSVEGASDPGLKSRSRAWRDFGMRDAAEALAFLKQNAVRNLFLAGSIPKSKMYAPDFRGDDLTRQVLKKNRRRGDTRLMNAVVTVLKVNGIHVMDPAAALKDFLVTPGPLKTDVPDAAQRRDIAFGLAAARSVGRLDIGQAVAVKNGTVLAVEAIEGTNRMLERLKDLALEGAVIVKCAKPGQDLRLDMPVVGLETVTRAAQARAAVLAIEAGKSLFLQRDEALNLARQKGLKVYGI